jgi:hypothetical protein
VPLFGALPLYWGEEVIFFLLCLPVEVFLQTQEDGGDVVCLEE